MAERWILRDDDGLLIEPHGAARLARRPQLVVEAASAPWPACVALRVSVSNAPRLWAVIDGYWDDAALLLSGAAESPAVVPPITMPTVRRAPRDAQDHSWWEAWIRWFADELVASARSPLYPSRWRLDPAAEIARRPLPAVRAADAVLTAAPCRFERDVGPGGGRGLSPGDGGLLALRRSSDPGSGRVTSWRKRVREGICPPVLLMYLDMLGKYLVLDGHDRLHAFALEGREVPCVVLWPELPAPSRYREGDRRSIAAAAERILGEHEVPPHKLVTHVNDWVVSAFKPWSSDPRTRAFRLTIGLEGWRSEVRKRLGELGPDADERAVALLRGDTD